MKERDEHLTSIDEPLCRRFEKAWLENQPERIEDCLPPEADARYLGTLEELVHLDMEFAWKTRSVQQDDKTVGTPLRVEDYLARFPALNQAALVGRLVRLRVVTKRCFWGAE